MLLPAGDTYGLHIDTLLTAGLHSDTLLTAYRVWINGQEYPGVGTVGNTRATTTPQLL